MRFAAISKKRCLGFAIFIFGIGCNTYINDSEEVSPIARVGEHYLYPDNIDKYLTENMSSQDSAAFTVNFINKWASKQLLLSKSKINLPEEKILEFDQLVEEYRTDLYTRAYIEALVQAANDTVLLDADVQSFYDKNKQNFKLNEKVVQLRFVALPTQFMNTPDVIKRLRRFEAEDKDYLDSIAVQVKKIHLNDSIWVSASNIMAEVPPINQKNQEKHLKKSQFFELRDSLALYLGYINDVREINEIAPLSYSIPDIKRIIRNRRRLAYIKKLETEIIDEAIKSNEFEIYGK